MNFPTFASFQILKYNLKAVSETQAPQASTVVLKLLDLKPKVLKPELKPKVLKPEASSLNSKPGALDPNS